MKTEEFAGRQVARSAIYVALKDLTQYLVFFLFYVVIARILTQEEIGIISVLNFVMFVFSHLTQFAIPVASTKFISENIGKGDTSQISAVAKTAFKLVSIISFPSTVLLCLASPQLSLLIFGTREAAYLLVIVFTASLFLNFRILLTADLQGLNMFLEVTISTILFVVVSRGIGIVLASQGYGIVGVTIGWLLGGVISLVVAYNFLRGELGTSAEGFPLKIMVLYSYPIVFYTLLNILQQWIDIMLLYVLTADLAETGIYYLVVNGIGTFAVLWIAITTPILPASSARYVKRGSEAIEDISRIATRLLNLLVIPIGICLAVASKTVIRVAYGSTYLSGSAPFALLALSLLIPAYFTLFATILQAIGETKVFLKIGVASILADVLTIVLLVKSLGMMGAAASRIIMFTVALILSYRSLKKKVRIHIDVTSFWKAAVLSAVGALPIIGVEWFFIDVAPFQLVKLLVEGILFLCVVFITASKLKPFEAQDFELLKQAVPERLHRPLDLAKRFFSRKTI